MVDIKTYKHTEKGITGAVVKCSVRSNSDSEIPRTQVCFNMEL